MGGECIECRPLDSASRRRSKLYACRTPIWIGTPPVDSGRQGLPVSFSQTTADGLLAVLGRASVLCQFWSEVPPPITEKSSGFNGVFHAVDLNETSREPSQRLLLYLSGLR